MRILGKSAGQEAVTETRETKYRRMLDNLPVGIYQVTPNGKILEANRKFAQLLGYSTVEELKTVNMNGFYIKPSDRGAFTEKLRESDLTAEFELRRKDGTTIWIRDYPKAAISLDGYITHLDGVVVETHGINAITQHIGEDKRLDMKRMREQFISSVTHELRTPLISIKGYADYLLAKEDTPVPDSIRSSLEIIKRNADRLSNLVNDLLDVQRIEAGKLELKLETFNLREILDNCIEEMVPTLKQKEQKIRLDAPTGPVNIHGDRLRLTEVFTNLLNNATKFTPKDGEISVRVKEEGESICVSIHDTGIGIDKVDIERVFEPFAAIEKPTYIKGTGLGLSLSKRLIEAHGGKMWVDSPGKGHGTTIGFSLPNRLEEVTVNG